MGFRNGTQEGQVGAEERDLLESDTNDIQSTNLLK